MTEWVAPAVVLAIHDEQIAEHGGAPGVRSFGLLESALHCPQNLQANGSPDIADLAAAYAFGIARNHPFVDGNKRVLAVVTLTFLRLNGYDIDATAVEHLNVWIALGTGKLSEKSLATWMRERIVKR